MKAKIFGLISVIGILLLFLFIAPLRPLFADTTPDTSSSISANPGELPADGSSTSTVTVTLRNSGNLITSGTVSLSITNGASVNQGSVTLGSAGTATFPVTSTTLGTDTVTVIYNGTTVDNLSTQITFDTPVTSTGTPTPTPLNYCGDSAPGSTPQLLSAVSNASHEVTLTWSAASAPVTNYLLSYGLSPGNYIYGNPNFGGPDTTSYTVGNLSNGVTYYFAIRAVNGCMPGSVSNEISGRAGVVAATPIPTDTIDTSSDTVSSDMPVTEAPTDTDTPTPTPTVVVSAVGSTTGGTALSAKLIGFSIAGIGVLIGIAAFVFSMQSKKKKIATPESITPIQLHDSIPSNPNNVGVPDNQNPPGSV